MNDDHIVLIRSDGSGAYEDGYDPEDEEEFEDDDVDEF